MNKIKQFLSVVIFTFSCSVFAQDDDLPPTDDTPLASINDCLPILLFAPLLYAFYIFKSKGDSIQKIH